MVQRRGFFLVQSAYKLGVEDQKKVKCGSSSSLRWSSFWKKLWSAKVPHKIKIFMWRACSNILPTCTRLFERKIGSNYSCPICFEKAETTAHIFMECKIARSTWNIHTHFAQLLSRSHTDFVDLVEEVLTQCGSPEIEIFKVNVASFDFKAQQWD
jgi:hypothetical protein